MSRSAIPLLVVAYTMTRAALTLGHFDEVAMPPFELGVMGNLAWLASRGDTVLPLHLWFDNVGGHLAVGFLAAPLYALLGDHYVVLKLVPLVFGIGTLVLLVRLLERLSGPRAAWAVGLLFVLAPPTLAKYSVLAKGNHFEGLLLQFAAYAALVRLHPCPDGAPERSPGPSRARGLFVLGLSAGLAISFYVGALLTVAGLGLAHLALAGWRRALRDLPPALLGGALGLAPLLAIALAPDGRFLAFARAKLSPLALELVPTVAQRLGDLAAVVPRAGGWPAVGLPARVPELLFLVAFALAWLAVGARLVNLARGVHLSGSSDQRARTLLLLPAWLHLPSFALVFGLTTFDFDRYLSPVEVGEFRYLIPHLAFALVLVAACLPVAASNAEPRPRRRPAIGSVAGCAPLVAAGLAAVLGAAGVVRGHAALPAARPLAYPGTHFAYLANVLFKQSQVDPASGERVFAVDRIAAQLERVPAEVRGEVAFGVGHHLAWIAASPEIRRVAEPPRLSLVELLRPFPSELAPNLARGVGSHVRQVFGSGAEGRERAADLLAQLLAEGHPATADVVVGLCLDFHYSLAHVAGSQLELTHAIRELVPEEWRPTWRQGVERQCAALGLNGCPSEVERDRTAKLARPRE